MIKIAVVDDEKEFAEMFEQKIKAFLGKYNLECHIARYMSADELIRGEKVYDLFFLDIDMAGMDGMELAGKLRKKHGASVDIVFVTSVETAVFDAFSVDAMGFVRKSVLDSDFQRSMEKFIEKWNARNVKWEFRTVNGLIYKSENEIIMAEVYGHKMMLHCTDMVYEIRGTIDDLMKRLSGNMFVQPYRGYLVNCEFIDRIANDNIFLENGTKIPLSRRNQKEVRKTFLQYISNIAGR